MNATANQSTAGGKPAPVDLTRFAWLSIGAAVATIGLKVVAWLVTDSVSLLSDAAESLVNLVAAVLALAMLKLAAKPPDDGHNFGHAKAEYFSAAAEGIMIFVAAVLIIVAAIERLLSPRPLEAIGVGVVVALVASLINGAVGWILVRAGRRHRSPTLVADGKHLWTDVVTSVGVVVGLVLVLVTGWSVLDPIVALLVGVNIIITGFGLIRESANGLMDATLPTEDNDALAAILARRSDDRVAFHGLRTRQAGRHRFAAFDILVPGDWTVRAGHDLIEEIAAEIDEALPGLELNVHLEPREDPRSYNDYAVEIPIPD
ncbi:MAG: cation diffusion facilitator family transporter [Propionibacteriaceae bacterium]|jgi:cation diffusion facilitator family transporter|nr:cation diffusion facilitator family transporter [Propionibacteriaceae bacterium]